MKHKLALAIAQRLIEAMRPHCERIELAGSLRREKSGVRDLEIVAIPHRVEVVSGATLFETTTEMRSELHHWAATEAVAHGVRWIKPVTSEIIDWAPKPDAKYLRALVTAPEGQIKLDLFLCRAENWGIIHLIRTGSAEFSQAVVTRARAIGKPIAGGTLTENGKDIATPEEADVFRVLGLHQVVPAWRLDGRQVQVVKATP